VPVPVYLMQTNGGVAAAERAQQLPIGLASSGPAAGVIGGARLASNFNGRGLATHPSPP
jgi:N-methylhydantoinase A